jgi:hypothetical protein
MFLVIRRFIALVATLAVVAAVSGCSESARGVATGKSNIRGINAIVTAPEVNFLIEERSFGNIDFKDNSGFNSFDDLSYDFNFDLFLPGVLTATRLTTQFIDVLADHDYTVVLTGTIANPSSFFWEDPVREWSGTETFFEIFFGHLAPSVGELDVYFATTGTVPVLGQAVGSVSNGDRLPALELEAGQYELILTPKDNPATIIYQSVPVAAAAQTQVLVAVFDPDPSVLGNVGVNFIPHSGGSSVLADINFPPQVRTLHAAFDTANFDGYFNSDFANIIYSDIGFQELSPYAEVFDATTLLTLTPVGNSGATIHEGDVSATAGTKRTVVLAGVPGALLFIPLLDDARPLETFPIFRILNASFTTAFLDIYILPPGTPLEDLIIPQIRSIPTTADTGFAATSTGMLEFTVTLAGEKTPISTPLILDLANGDTVDAIIVDTVNPGTVEMIVFDSQ